METSWGQGFCMCVCGNFLQCIFINYILACYTIDEEWMDVEETIKMLICFRPKIKMMFKGNTVHRLPSEVPFIQWTLYKCWWLLLLWLSSSLYVYHFLNVLDTNKHSGVKRAKLNLLHDFNFFMLNFISVKEFS